MTSVVLPEEIVIIPKFLMFHIVPDWLFGYSLINTWWPLILPSWVGGGAFNVFLMRQFLMQLPRELDEAATLDGAGPFRILWNVLLPMLAKGTNCLSKSAAVGSKHCGGMRLFGKMLDQAVPGARGAPPSAAMAEAHPGR